jgi:hypothetical protein
MKHSITTAAQESDKNMISNEQLEIMTLSLTRLNVWNFVGEA